MLTAAETDKLLSQANKSLLCQGTHKEIAFGLRLWDVAHDPLVVAVWRAFQAWDDADRVGFGQKRAMLDAINKLEDALTDKNWVFD